MSESNELAAAVERLKAIDAIDDPVEKLSHHMEYNRLHWVIADAVLPEFDATLVTPSALRAIGFKDSCNDEHDYLWINSPAISFDLQYFIEPDTFWMADADGGVSIQRKTMGEVKSLCRALGIKLKEQA